MAGTSVRTPRCRAGRRGVVWPVAVAVVGALLGVVPAGGQETYVLVISGLGGEESYSDSFFDWSVTLTEAARQRGVPEENLYYLAEDETRDPQRIDGKSSRETVEKTLQELAAKAGAEDLLWIVLIGHGSYQQGATRFNLPGRDMAAEDFARALEGIKARVAFVNTASSSGGFVPLLAGENRVIVTATKSGFERNEPLFGGYFVEAFGEAGDADVDKDDQVSLLEGFDYARRKVGGVYQSENRLLTEHAVLDDNGDGKGSTEPSLEGEDGPLAHRLFLAQAPEAKPGLSPEHVALLRERRELEERIAELRSQRDGLAEELYLKELEALLLELARVRQAIRRSAETPSEVQEEIKE